MLTKIITSFTAAILFAVSVMALTATPADAKKKTKAAISKTVAGPTLQEEILFKRAGDAKGGKPIDFNRK